MIDLHMHTNYSDGTDEVEDLLKKAQEKNLEVISITDHNTLKPYFEMKNMNIKKFFTGNIIVGCEFTTSFNQRLIEVLGYGFSIDKIQKYLENYYVPEKIKQSSKILYERLVHKLEDFGFVYDIENLSDQHFFEKRVYEELIRHPENKQKINEDIFSSFSDFYRKGLTNPKSKMFMNHAEFFPSLKEILKEIHDSNGLVFLAHPFQYKFTDTEDFLEEIYTENPMDGIECMYTTFNENQTNYLIKFAKRKNLKISGGSDYHGTNKKMHDIGVGKGNLKIKKEILNDWNIDFFI